MKTLRVRAGRGRLGLVGLVVALLLLPPAASARKPSPPLRVELAVVGADPVAGGVELGLRLEALADFSEIELHWLLPDSMPAPASPLPPGRPMAAGDRRSERLRLPAAATGGEPVRVRVRARSTAGQWLERIATAPLRAATGGRRAAAGVGRPGVSRGRRLLEFKAGR